VPTRRRSPRRLRRRPRRESPQTPRPARAVVGRRRVDVAAAHDRLTTWPPCCPDMRHRHPHGHFSNHEPRSPSHDRAGGAPGERCMKPGNFLALRISSESHDRTSIALGSGCIAWLVRFVPRWDSAMTPVGSICT
jgi:hypothetical protein